MKIFLVAFCGHFLRGDMLVIDETKIKAFNKAKNEIMEMGLLGSNDDFSMDDLNEIDCLKKQCIVIDDGDY